MALRKLLAGLLALLLAFPACADNSVVGTVVRSELANLQGARLVPGSTLFSGDSIQVDSGGAARILLADGALLQLAEGSLVRLMRAGANTQVIIERGGVALRSTQTAPVEAVLGDATIRPADAAPTVGIIHTRGPDGAWIVAEKGRLNLRLAHDGSVTTLREGEAAEVRLLAETPGAQGAPGGQTSARRVIILALILGGVATAIAALLANQEPVTNNCNAVSPFRCP